MSEVPGNRRSQAVRRVIGKAKSLARSDQSATPAPTSKREAKPDRPRTDPRFVRSFWRVGRALLGHDALPETHEGLAFDPKLAVEMAHRAVYVNAMATLGEMVSHGRSIEEAHAATTRALANTAARHSARALTLGLEGLPSGRQIRHIGLGIVLHSMHLFELGWKQFKELDDDVLTRHVPLEAVQCALREGTPAAVATALAIAADPARLETQVLVELAGRFQVADHADVARRLVDEADRRDPADLDDHGTQMLANLHYWTHPTPPAEPVAGAVNVGVIDYHSPDLERASRNVGDYVQTLAMLGNLARFQKARFHGADGLGDLVTELQGRVREELLVDAGDSDVNLLRVSRDFSEGDPIPENTWMVAFGWHMHPLFRVRFGMPYHPNLNPIFVSFHINRPPILTPETIDYLKAHGPIGCRDWTTVDLLLSAGVDAFFTGCLTTTVNAVFPDLADVERDEQPVVAVIDLPKSVAKGAKRPVELITHGDAAYRDASLAEGTHAAIDLLSGYQRRFHRIMTSRLHSYLPATSLGVPVKFTPHIPGDVRFEGLYGMKPGLPAFEQMRGGIRHLIKETFELVLAGADSATVYAHWREITADLVAEAKARFNAPPSELSTVVDVPGLVDRISSAQRSYGPHDSVDPDAVTDIAMSTDQNFRGFLPVTLESVVANASGPLRVWVTVRGITPEYEQWLSDAFPDLPITFLSFDDIDYGVIGRMIKHITVSTMDRLLLPEVLTDLDRITYIDIDTVTEGDVCELAGTDLRGLPLAARTSVYAGSMIWRSAGDLLSPDRATELRRRMSFRHAFDFLTFNAGVLVLDLQRMRKDHFSETYLPMAGEFGLNDQDILNAYVGPDRVELDPRWNSLPVQEIIENPGVIHYAGAGKPWNDELTPYGEHWKHYSARFANRVGRPLPE